ncbi:polyhydroxyalkanoate synthesis regulator DNA-binding domain-containing protein [soil metagenome]
MRYLIPVNSETAANPTRLIKRYANRKLYDVEASAYVTLDDIAALVRRGDTVAVVDNVTGEDITAQTLTQIVVEEGKRGGNVLPIDLLHDVLRRSGSALEGGFEHLRHGVDDLVAGSFGRVTRALGGAKPDDVTQLRERLAELERAVGRLLDDAQDTPSSSGEG